MGGKALNQYGVYTERKNTEEFLKIGQELRDKVSNDHKISVLDTSIVTCYRSKSDHGDLDLLICVYEGIDINWKSYIEKTFKPRAINSNGGVYSFDYQNFQIDFIPINEKK